MKKSKPKTVTSKLKIILPEIDDLEYHTRGAYKFLAHKFLSSSPPLLPLWRGIAPRGTPINNNTDNTIKKHS